MTEAEWFACESSDLLLDYLGHKVSARKRRLFATGLCRLLWEILSDKRSRKAIRKLEDYADDLGNEQLRQDAFNIANAAGRESPSLWTSAASCAAIAVFQAAGVTPPPNLHGNFAAALQRWQGVNGFIARRRETDVVRELFVNPFRPVTVAPEWRTDTVLALARQMYESRNFGAMPILADALQDAGCDSEDVLTHCRDPHQVHVRGCWVVDLVLGKD